MTEVNQGQSDDNTGITRDSVCVCVCVHCRGVCVKLTESYYILEPCCFNACGEEESMHHSLLQLHQLKNSFVPWLSLHPNKNSLGHRRGYKGKPGNEEDQEHVMTSFLLRREECQVWVAL